MDSDKQNILAKIESAIDSVRPHLQGDGGDVELLGINDDQVVSVKWLGACKQCEMSKMTLKAGLEQAIRTAVPEVKEVIAVREETTVSND